MKTSETPYLSPRWSSEILDCSMPMTLDTYSNCAFQCVYCFAYFQRAVSSEDYLAHLVRSVDVERVKRMFLHPDEHAGQFAWYIKRKYVLQWGGLSDGFDWYEKKLRKSLELLRFFREIGYPISVSSKGTWFLDDPEYVEALRGAENVHWKISLITDEEPAAKKLERGTASPDERYRAMERLAKLGVVVTLRFRPYVLGVSDRSDVRMIQRAHEAGAYSTTTEFLCLEGRASRHGKERWQRISEVCGFDVWQFYRSHSYRGAGGLMRLNYSIKRPYILRMQEACDALGMPFFVSDAHHKERSASAGCCGLPSTGVLGNYFKGHFAEAILIARRRGSVHWRDIAPYAEELRNIPFRFATGFNTGGTEMRMRHAHKTMYDFMRGCWNDTESWSSPARYFGGALVPDSDLDDEGNVVYLYNRAFIEDGARPATVEEVRGCAVPQTAQDEERRQDGGPWGHVAYPILVVAPRQGGDVPLLGQLQANRLDARLVVHASQRASYDGRADILPYDGEAPLAAAARAMAAEGYERLHVFDGSVLRLLRKDGPNTLRAGLSWAERAADGAPAFSWACYAPPRHYREALPTFAGWKDAFHETGYVLVDSAADGAPGLVLGEFGVERGDSSGSPVAPPSGDL